MKDLLRFFMGWIEPLYEVGIDVAQIHYNVIDPPKAVMLYAYKEGQRAIVDIVKIIRMLCVSEKTTTWEKISYSIDSFMDGATIVYAFLLYKEVSEMHKNDSLFDMMNPYTHVIIWIQILRYAKEIIQAALISCIKPGINKLFSPVPANTGKIVPLNDKKQDIENGLSIQLPSKQPKIPGKKRHTQETK